LAATRPLSSQEVAAETPGPSAPREGDTKPPKKRRQKKSSCRRPGCIDDWNIDLLQKNDIISRWKNKQTIRAIARDLGLRTNRSIIVVAELAKSFGNR